jgi:hypothetical protein
MYENLYQIFKRIGLVALYSRDLLFLFLVLHMEKQKGTLVFGADADFILLDDKLNVLSTFIAGEQAWTINDKWSIDNLRI